MDDCIFNPLPSAVILSVFVKQLLFFVSRHMWQLWHIESQGGSFCDVILLNLNIDNCTTQYNAVNKQFIDMSECVFVM